jgi:microcystin-dependent protein
MSCSNCYNGCAEIVSDKCVRYTGIDVPVLGIQTGDSLSYIEQSLIEFLTSTLNGVGIKPIIDPAIICAIVNANLPTCGEFTLNDYLSALIKSVCDLQTQIVVLDSRLDVIEANYTVECLTGVTSTSGTHAILQAVITKLCDFDLELSALALDVDTNYVKISELDTLIQAYLDSLPASSKQYNKMIPYTVVEYYGSLSYFDATGAGLGDWEKIYLCNGLNGTPDKRGRVPVGAIQLVPGGALSSVVNPAVAGNPNYAVGDAIFGANTITLSAAQIPAHTHVATTAVTVTDTHRHFIAADIAENLPNLANATSPIVRTSNEGIYAEYALRANTTGLDATVGRTSQTAVGSINVGVGVTNAVNVGDQSHSNIQPTLACYYIMYIP